MHEAHTLSGQWHAHDVSCLLHSDDRLLWLQAITLAVAEGFCRNGCLPCEKCCRVNGKWLACRMEIITPTDYVGPLMELAQARRGDFKDMTYLTETRTTLVYDMPLAEVRI